jgi:hypothetical protein
MSPRTCAKQSEVLAMQAQGHWPDACAPELRLHLVECRSCAELLKIKQLFKGERANASIQAQLPAAGTIWWRAQLRRRNAAIERVGKPIFGAYVFALATTVLVAVIFAMTQARQGLRWLGWFEQLPAADLHTQSSGLLAALNPGWGLALLIPVFASLVLVGALFVYLAGERQ